VSYISLFQLNQETWSFVNEELALFVHTTHPLAQREKVELIDLRNENFILFNQELIYNLIIQECLRAGFRPKIAYEISEWGFISEMIGENIGISICPKPIAKKVNQDLIKVVSIENPSIPWSLGFISKKRKHMSPAVREFIKYISAELPF
jgi:DNA-binding transcriptional LysR family regulator